MIVNLILKKGRLSSFRSASSFDLAESNLYSLNSRYLALFPNLSVKNKTKQNYSITNLMIFFFHHSHDENMKNALLVPVYIIIKWWWTKNSLSFLIIVAFCFASSFLLLAKECWQQYSSDCWNLEWKSPSTQVMFFCCVCCKWLISLMQRFPMGSAAVFKKILLAHFLGILTYDCFQIWGKCFIWKSFILQFLGHHVILSQSWHGSSSLQNTPSRLWRPS